jgi:general stress protein 26
LSEKLTLLYEEGGNFLVTTETELLKLSQLIQGTPVVMLTTIEPSGSLSSRPMAAPHLENETEMWFLTLEHSTKVEDVRRFPQVNVTFMTNDKNRFISVRGRAQVESDPIKRAEIWSPAYKTWFPNGLEDPDLTLLKVVVERVECWNSDSSYLVQLIDFSSQASSSPHKTAEVTIEKKLH